MEQEEEKTNIQNTLQSTKLSTVETSAISKHMGKKTYTNDTQQKQSMAHECTTPNIFTNPSINDSNNTKIYTKL